MLGVLAVMSVKLAVDLLPNKNLVTGTVLLTTFLVRRTVPMSGFPVSRTVPVTRYKCAGFIRKMLLGVLAVMTVKLAMDLLPG